MAFTLLSAGSRSLGPLSATIDGKNVNDDGFNEEGHFITKFCLFASAVTAVIWTSKVVDELTFMIPVTFELIVIALGEWLWHDKQSSSRSGVAYNGAVRNNERLVANRIPSMMSLLAFMISTFHVFEIKREEGYFFPRRRTNNTAAPITNPMAKPSPPYRYGEVAPVDCSSSIFACMVSMSPWRVTV